MVQYSGNGGASWSTFNDGVSSSTSTTVTGLTQGNTYLFRVAAASGGLTGVYSAPLEVFLQPPPGATGSYLGANGNNISSFIDFSSPTLGPVTGYTVEASSSAGTSSFNIPVSGWSPNTFTEVTFPSQGNRTYTVKVRAYNGGGAGPWSWTNQFTTYAGLPLNLKTTPTTTSANFSWSAPTNSVGPITYLVAYSSDTDSNVYAGTWSPEVAVTGTQYTFTGLAGDTNYRFRVTAVGIKGTDTPVMTSAKTLPYPPNSPSSLSLDTATSSSMGLSFSPPNVDATHGVPTGYRVEYSSNGGLSWNQASWSSTSGTVSGLA
ncbi:fibronectin type III domain-containing protein, partial [bacterium]|nr:fibronectin type III domain-containing protein [bacterium]